MSYDIERLKEVVQNPFSNARYYHGDAQADLLEILESYTDQSEIDELKDENDTLEKEVEDLKDEVTDQATDIENLEKQIEELAEKLAEYE